MPKYNAIALIARIRDHINKQIVQELEKHNVTGIVPSHGDILMFLYREDVLSIKMLAERVHRTQPTVTVLVNKLEKLGYVERSKSAEDSRVTMIRLTEQGRQLEPVFYEVSQQINGMVYGHLTDDQADQLESLLTGIVRKL
ncbi:MULTISPECIES: MarR family winged helix-turn-helix transcriptional regulator [Paenibacillus]|uniref:DNA-binding MarR family transcriptional regulator n=1 Tax=Paenibacillus pabuli TaxID=1472 RepID=A0A855YC89_9BACL|nr:MULTISPECIES: MarR family transcriptional regulator [Paenibacillus]PWW42068.1 DNA-binding MarR family transcriptional regulator [Paenibacillus pabuli]PXW07456.1 DNA-binding MarR family transcriptional regulator [Paenibacillus taichungensis]RAI88235.1 DNA-binding MarR family transcriptional regulator [Paenibacillus pabuli]